MVLAWPTFEGLSFIENKLEAVPAPELCPLIAAIDTDCLGAQTLISHLLEFYTQLFTQLLITHLIVATTAQFQFEAQINEL